MFKNLDPQSSSVAKSVRGGKCANHRCSFDKWTHCDRMPRAKSLAAVKLQ